VVKTENALQKKGAEINKKGWVERGGSIVGTGLGRGGSEFVEEVIARVKHKRGEGRGIRCTGKKLQGQHTS